DDRVHVPVHAPGLVLSRLVRRLAGQVLVLREGRLARGPADLLPGRPTVAATRHTALLDADEDIIGRPRVEGYRADVGGMRRHGKRPSVWIRQLAEARQLARRAAAVVADAHRGRQ